MNRFFVLLLTLLLCINGKSSDKPLAMIEDDYSSTILDCASKGVDRALLVIVSGERSTAKSVRYGDKQLFELANELSITGIGHTAIYGLPLGSGETVADLVVTMTGEGNNVVTVIPCTGVDQAIPFEAVEATQGEGEACLIVEGASSWVMGILTSVGKQVVAPHDWDSIKGQLHILGRYVGGKDGLVKVSFGSVACHWTMAAVAVRESKEK